MLSRRTLLRGAVALGAAAAAAPLLRHTVPSDAAFTDQAQATGRLTVPGAGPYFDAVLGLDPIVALGPTSTDTWSDLSANQLDATVVHGAPSEGPTSNVPALSFVNTDHGYAYIPHHSLFNRNGKDTSFVFWAKVHHAFNPDNIDLYAWTVLFSKGNLNNSYRLNAGTATHWTRTQVWYGDGAHTSPTSPLPPDNEWAFWAYTAVNSGEKRLRIRRIGQPMASAAASWNSNVVNNTSPLSFAARGSTVEQMERHLTGSLAGFAMFDGILTEAQINGIYQASF